MLAVALLSVVLAACSGSRPKSDSLGITAPRIVGWLHTDGTRIIDQQGREVRLLATNVTGMQAGKGTALRESDAGTIGCEAWQTPAASVYDHIRAWGFNAVRIPISWANLEPVAPTTAADGSLVHAYNQAYLATLDGVVARYRARGIAVVLSMQQNRWTPAFLRVTDGTPGKCPGSGMPVWLYQGTSIQNVVDAKVAFFSNQGGVLDQFAALWRMVAARYASDPAVVGFDMLNEPYSAGQRLPVGSLHLDDLYRLVGGEIRAVNPNALLIFEDSQDQGDGVFAVSSPPPFSNVVYSFHLYRPDWDPDGLQVTQDHERRADAWNVPLWIGEFNLFRATANLPPPPSPGWEARSAPMLAYFKAHDIGWAVFAYSGASSIVIPSTGTPKPGILPTLQRGF